MTVTAASAPARTPSSCFTAKSISGREPFDLGFTKLKTKSAGARLANRADSWPLLGFERYYPLMSFPTPRTDYAGPIKWRPSVGAAASAAALHGFLGPGGPVGFGYRRSQAAATAHKDSGSLAALSAQPTVK